MLSTRLLLRLCCIPAKSAVGRAGADQFQQMLGSTLAGSAGSHLPAEPPASAFLKGSAAVLRRTLNQMPPQLLVGLFQELSSVDPQPQVSMLGPAGRLCTLKELPIGTAEALLRTGLDWST